MSLPLCTNPIIVSIDMLTFKSKLPFKCPISLYYLITGQRFNIQIGD